MVSTSLASTLRALFLNVAPASTPPPLSSHLLEPRNNYIMPNELEHATLDGSAYAGLSMTFDAASSSGETEATSVTAPESTSTPHPGAIPSSHSNAVAIGNMLNATQRASGKRAPRKTTAHLMAADVQSALGDALSPVQLTSDTHHLRRSSISSSLGESRAPWSTHGITIEDGSLPHANLSNLSPGNFVSPHSTHSAFRHHQLQALLDVDMNQTLTRADGTWSPSLHSISVDVANATAVRAYRPHANIDQIITQNHALTTERDNLKIEVDFFRRTRTIEGPEIELISLRKENLGYRQRIIALEQVVKEQGKHIQSELAKQSNTFNQARKEPGLFAVQDNDLIDLTGDQVRLEECNDLATKLAKLDGSSGINAGHLEGVPEQQMSELIDVLEAKVRPMGLDAHRTRDSIAMDAERQQHAEHRAEFTKALATTRQQLFQAEETSQARDDSLYKVRSERDKLSDELRLAQGTKEAKELQLQDLFYDHKQFQGKIDELQAQLLASVEQYKSTVTELEGIQYERNTMEARVKELIGKNATLQQRLAQSVTDKTQLEKDPRAPQEEVDRMGEQLRDVVREQDAKRSGLQLCLQQLEEYKTRCSKLEQHVQDLQEQLLEPQTHASNMQGELDTKNDTYSAAIVSVYEHESHPKILTQQLQNAKEDAIRADETVGRLRTEQEGAAHAALKLEASLKTECNPTEKHKEQLAKTEQQHVEAEEMWKEREGELTQLIHSKVTEYQAKQIKLRDVTDQIKGTEAKASAYAQHIDELEVKIDQAQAYATELEAQVKEKGDQYHEAVVLADEHQSKLTQAVQYYETLETEVQRLECELEEVKRLLHKERRDTSQTIGSLNKQLHSIESGHQSTVASKDEACQALKGEVDKYRIECDKLKTSLATLKHAQQEQAAQTAQEHQELASAKDAAHCKVMEMECTVQEAQKAIDDGQVQLSALLSARTAEIEERKQIDLQLREHKGLLLGVHRWLDELFDIVGCSRGVEKAIHNLSAVSNSHATLQNRLNYVAQIPRELQDRIKDLETEMENQLEQVLNQLT